MIKIETKTTGLFITIAILTSVLVAGLALWRSRSIIEEEAIQKMKHQVDSYANLFEQELMGLRYVSQSIEADFYTQYPKEGLNSGNIGEFKERLANHMLMLGEKMKPMSMWFQFSPDVVSGKHTVSFYDANRDGEYQKEIEYSINDLDLLDSSLIWWNDAIRFGEAWTRPYYWKNWDMELISYSKAVFVDSVLVGCLGSDFDFTNRRKAWGNTKLYSSGYFVLMDSEYRFIVHPKYKGQLAEEVLAYQLADSVLTSIESFNSGYLYYEFLGEKKVFAYKKLSNNWTFILTVPLREIYEPISRVAKSLLYIVLLVLGFSIGIAIFFSKAITKPILHLQTLFNKAVQGNLSVRSTIKTNDELEVLGDSFNYFMSEMQDLISQLNEQKTELIEAIKKAKESDRLKTAFLGNLSHELRTPLNGIISFSELMYHSAFTEDDKLSYYNIVQDNKEQLLGFIEDVLIFSELEQGLVKLKNDTFLVDEFIKNISSEIQSKCIIKKPEVSFQIVIPEEIEAKKISLDYKLVIKILEKLLDNANKFTHQGKIVFGVTIRDKSWGFFVKDTGIGIPKEYQDKIFDKFFKYAPDSNVLYAGVGMGLSISIGLAKLLGGTINVQSEKGKGSEFSLIFPFSSL